METSAGRPFLALPFLALFGVALASGRAQQREVTIATHAVAGPVSYLVGEGGNIGVSCGADGLLIVDDQFERLAPKIEAALGQLAPPSADRAPRFLINTHHHPDHTDGNKHFGKKATVLAHENVRARLVDQEAPARALPVVTYADGISLHFNGEEIRVIHVPGAHTDGDSVVWFTGSNAIHLGDLYFQVGYPFIDTGSGGDVEGMIAGLKRLLPGLPADVKVIPGHGELTGKAELEGYVAMLATITERVREHLAQGHDVEAMMAAGVTQDFDARWGQFQFVPPRKFVESVVASLGG